MPGKRPQLNINRKLAYLMPMLFKCVAEKLYFVDDRIHTGELDCNALGAAATHGPQSHIYRFVWGEFEETEMVVCDPKTGINTSTTYYNGRSSLEIIVKDDLIVEGKYYLPSGHPRVPDELCVFFYELNIDVVAGTIPGKFAPDQIYDRTAIMRKHTLGGIINQ